MTKILYINTSDYRGGAARLAMDLKSGMEERSGFETSLFVKEKSSEDPSVFLVKKKNRFLKWVSGIVGKDMESFWHNRWHYLLSNDIEFFDNRNLLDAKELEEADIIHCHNLHNSYFNLRNLEKISREKPVVWSLHDMWAFTAHEVWSIKDGAGNILFEMEAKPHLLWNNRKHLLETKRKIYERSRLYIVPTSLWLEGEVKKSILKNKKLRLIQNGIDENIYKKRDKKAARRELGLPENKKIISFAAAGGRQNPQKGWPYVEAVIRHFENNRDILFLCIGGAEDGEKRSNLIYIPYIDEEKKFALYYNASDIFINPSMAEAFCVVLVQALSSEIPVVSFPTGVAPEAVKHGVSGYIAKYQSTEDFINGVLYILSRNEGELRKMGRIGRKTVLEKFTKKIMIGNYASLYKKVLDDRRKITIFSLPKAFMDPEVRVVQSNAILCWKNLENVEVIIIGDEDGIKEFSAGAGVRHINKVQRSAFGTPLLDDAFASAERDSSGDILMYSNSDIIFFDDLGKAVSKLPEGPFLAVGRRTDLDVKAVLDWSSANEVEKLKRRAKEEGKLHSPAGIDYFIFRKGTLKIPPLVVGRIGWDNFMIWNAKFNKIPVIDLTAEVLAIHQNHRPGAQNSDKRKINPEALHNVSFIKGHGNAATIEDADYRMIYGELVKNRFHWLPKAKRIMRNLLSR